MTSDRRRRHHSAAGVPEADASALLAKLTEIGAVEWQPVG